MATRMYLSAAKTSGLGFGRDGSHLGPAETHIVTSKVQAKKTP